LLLVFLRRGDRGHAELVGRFLAEYPEIKKTRITTDVQATGRFGTATTVHNQ
jgi:hypothetical protein